MGCQSKQPAVGMWHRDLSASPSPTRDSWRRQLLHQASQRTLLRGSGAGSGDRESSSAFEISAFEISTLKVAALKVGATEVRVLHVAERQVCFLEVRTLEVRVNEV